MINIKKIPVGYLQANCYILEFNNQNIIIDPGSEFDKIKANIKGNVCAILVTHRHFDHIGALADLKNEYHCPIYDFNNLKEQKYEINNFKFKVVYTPGHTDDSVSYYFYDENIMFTGDFLFKETIGRTDLETGNMDKMLNSLNKILKYNDIKIYPGHGDITTLDYEKNNNIYLKEYK